MKLKTLLLPIMALVPAMSMAATYYVSPEGSGSKDGSSWENAMDLGAFTQQAANNANGDVYNLAGGVYQPTSTIIFKVATGCTLLGNADGERTVFSGDQNGSGHPNDGDLGRLIRFQANTRDGVSTNAIVVKNVDFTCVFTNTNTDTDTMGALMIDNSGDVLVEDCNFYSNWAEGQQGGAAVHSYRSTVYFRNCVFRDNSTVGRGGAIRLRSNDGAKGVTTFESCVISGNTNYHNFGGAIFMAHGKQLNIINSTIYGNKAAADGAAIYINGKDNTYPNKLVIVGSTIANNRITGETPNSQIASTQSANISVVNSIVVSDEVSASAFYFRGNTESSLFNFESAGWNCVGSMLDAADEPTKEIAWSETDKHGADYTFAHVFGDNTLTNEGVVKPAIFVQGASAAQTAEAVAAWGLPADAQIDVDQLGEARTAESLSGAYSDASAFTSGIDGAAIDDAVTVEPIGGGAYSITGAAGPVKVYDVSGRLVATTNDNVISLAGKSAGIYIFRIGNKVYKIVK